MSSERALPQDKIAEIRNNFNFFDRDQNGEIDLDEFAELLKVLSPRSSIDQAEKGFQFIDENNDGHIDFEEFLHWWQQCWWEY